MTCAGQETGSVIETKVTGFVAAAGRPACGSGGEPRGRAGGKGLLGGSGIRRGGDRGQPASNPKRDGGRRERGGPRGPGRAGLGAGAASAGRRVADYLIRRAEQYQPVIQLQTGTRVTVVFIEGARIDGREEKKKKQATSRGETDEYYDPSTNRKTLAADHDAPGSGAPCRLRGGSHVGESWQCPLAQGVACASVSEADLQWRLPEGPGKTPSPPRFLAPRKPPGPQV